MTINITSKQMDITPAIRQHVEDRLSKLDKWQTQLINPHIILSKEPQGFVADATISTPNGPLVASSKHDDMYAGVNNYDTTWPAKIKIMYHKAVMENKIIC